MRPSRLRKRVQIQVNAPVRGQFGGETDSWTTIATVWGGLAPQVQSTAEREYAQQVKAVNRTLITLRYYAGLTAAHRLLMDGRIFAIDSVNNLDERNRELTVVCKEVA